MENQTHAGAALLQPRLVSGSFTPGPWQITRSDHSDHVDVWQSSGIGHIAAVSTGIGPDKTAQANARLIAAAPDMLAALQEVALCLEDSEYSENGYARTLIRDVITKAGCWINSSANADVDATADDKTQPKKSNV